MMIQTKDTRLKEAAEGGETEQQRLESLFADVGLMVGAIENTGPRSEKDVTAMLLEKLEIDASLAEVSGSVLEPLFCVVFLLLLMNRFKPYPLSYRLSKHNFWSHFKNTKQVYLQN